MPTTVRTACTRDCPDACSLLATVDGGRVVRLAGDPEHPVTRGFLCYRVGTHYLARHHSPERLTTPLRRRGTAFVPIGWDEALDRVAGRLDRIRATSGAAAILHVQGGGSLGMLKNLNGLFSRTLGASETRGDVCDAAGAAANVADFGACDANDVADLENARAIVLWGKNLAASSPHTVPFVTAARRRGVPVWLIDPLPHRTRRLADRYVRSRPGGDGALALAAARVVLDEGWQDPELAAYAEDVDGYLRLVRSRGVAEWAAEADVVPALARDLARLFVEHTPVTSLLGWGLQRRVNGAHQVRAIDALHALTGNLGRPGAGASFTTPRRRPFDLGMVEAAAANVPRTLRMPLLGADLLAAADPPVRAVLIDNGNPVASNADSETTRRALASRELVVVLDAFLTDTARTAHVVLPTTTMLEEADLVGSYGHHHMAVTRPVVERLPGTRTDLEVYQALADRLGFGAVLAGTPEEWMDRMLGRSAAAGVTRADLAAGGAIRDPNAPRIAFAGRRFATPSGRFRFLTTHAAAPPLDPEYPLVLHGLSTGRWQGSQLTEADEDREGPLVVTVHPAAAGGVPDGGAAWLASRLAALPVLVRHDADYRRDTVYVPRARSVARRLCVNLLVRARLTDAGEGCAYYDEGVRLQTAAPEEGR